MRDRKVPEEQIDHYLGHLPQGAAKMTRIYAPFEPQHCGEACAAIESFMTDVRKHLKKASLDDPEALVVADARGRLTNGHLGAEKVALIRKLIESGTGVMDITREAEISTTMVYWYRKKFTGRTRK